MLVQLSNEDKKLIDEVLIESTPVIDNVLETYLEVEEYTQTTKESIVITLSNSEVELCKLMARLRYESARQAGVKDQRIDTSNEMLDLNGFAAELAFCKHFNLYPDFTVGARKGGYDATTRKGKTVDVKCTKYDKGHLVAHKGKEIGQSDIYVLLIGELPTYKLVGWVHESELLNKANLKDLGHGVGYALAQNKLRAF